MIDPIPKLKPYLEGDEFDAVMNYNFAFTSSDYFMAEKSRIKTSEVDRRLRELREAFPRGVAEVQQNLFGSHDTDRIGSHIVNRDRERYGHWGDYFAFSKVDSGKYDPRKPTDEEFESQKLFAIFQMTYVGAPMIYYGDEVGMWGANDPDCRKPMVWDDLDYADEVFLPDGKKKPVPDKVVANKELFGHYRKLIALRNELESLRVGSFETLVTDDERQIYGFKRKLGEEEVVVLLNNAGEEQTVEFPGGGGWRDRWNDSDAVSNDDGVVEVVLPRRGGAILVRQ